MRPGQSFRLLLRLLPSYRRPRPPVAHQKVRGSRVVEPGWRMGSDSETLRKQSLGTQKFSRAPRWMRPRGRSSSFLWACGHCPAWAAQRDVSICRRVALPWICRGGLPEPVPARWVALPLPCRISPARSTTAAPPLPAWPPPTATSSTCRANAGPLTPISTRRGGCGRSSNAKAAAFPGGSDHLHRQCGTGAGGVLGLRDHLVVRWAPRAGWGGGAALGGGGNGADLR